MEIPPLPNDGTWLAAAARLAERARPLSRPNPGVGALIVRGGIVIGRGWTQPGGRPHAEAAALAQAGAAARGATLYATLEPCAHTSERGPSCAQIIASSGIARCVYGVPDPDPRTAGKGAEKMQQAGVAVTQLNCPHASASLAGYLMRSNHGRPLVTLKLALSLDGCIAMAGGESRWITGDIARAHVHAQRARHDAIIVGAGTWRADSPRLDVRLAGLETRSPRPIVLTRAGDVGGGIETMAQPQAICHLADIFTAYLEGGAHAAAAFLSADLVDRLHIYRAPIIIGGGLPGIADIGLTSLDRAHDCWHLASRCQLGSDTFEAYQRTRSTGE